MLNLNYLNINLSKAQKDHLDFFLPLIKGKIEKNPKYPFFINFLNEKNNIELLIIGKPINLFELNEKFENLVVQNFSLGQFHAFINKSKSKRKGDNSKIAKFFKYVRTIFNYDILKSDEHYNSYSLTTNLGVRTCVYCNRNYTLTQRKRDQGRLMNPQLDHWYPQSRYPLLQISFHNLIPCCEICNTRVKNETPFSLKTHFHPYQEKQKEIYFNYRIKYLNDQYEIFFTDQSDPIKKSTCEEMFIDRMYEAHQYELSDLIKLKEAYSESYLKSLRYAFPGANLTDNDIYRLAIGTESDPKEFHKRPMSKFKYDILKELKII
jgi:hypothetical protein